MIRKVNSLIAAFLIVGLALYVVLLNRESLTIALVPNREITAPEGVILIAVFGIGILVTALVAFFFGLKSYLRERGLLSRERQREAFFNLQTKARSLAASGEHLKAREIWLQVLRKDPENIIARIECSKLLEADGDKQEALRILDSARTVAPDNIEVLFRAAELNASIGNKTAAVDNLALILYHHPVPRAAELARNLSEELGRIDDAIEYHAQLEKLTHLGGENDEVLSRLKFRKLVKDSGGDNQALAESLKTHVKRFPNSEEPLLAFAEIEAAHGDIESAAQYLVKGARATGRMNLWRRATSLWLNAGKPDRALATARSCTKETSGNNRVQAEVELARTYVALNMFDDAQAALDNVSSLARSETIALTPEVREELHLLKALCLCETGQAKESAQTLRAILNPQKSGATASQELPATGFTASGAAPEPRLSTP